MDEQDFTLGVDLACSAAHVATLADAAGRLVWSNHRFRTVTVELERLLAKLPAGARLQLVIEPTRNAWVPLAADRCCRIEYIKCRISRMLYLASNDVIQSTSQRRSKTR